jgi:4-amino-4-deoxy-L-arabinose transferase-like glycosyltransferase
MDDRTQQNEGWANLVGLQTGRRRTIGIVLLGLTLICSLAALILYPQTERAASAWLFYLGSLVLSVITLGVLFSAQRKTFKLDWVVIGIGVVILGLATFMRLYRFDTVPFGTWFDEADIGLQALQILREPTFRPIFFEQATNAHFVHFPFLVAQAFRLFGVDTSSVRAVTVIFGLGTVIVAYFLGREAHGKRFGLILAFFFAVGRWHVTFSRIGMSTITAPFFILLTLYLLLRAQRTEQARDFGLAGLVLGIGLGFHPSMRLFPIVVLIFLIYWSRYLWLQRTSLPELRTAWVINLLVFLLWTGLALAPVAQYAIREPERFLARSNEVSIFQNRDEPDLGRALVSNTVKHSLMFNYQGDRNGRHNLPGEPILDPITGVLFVLGFGLAISRWRQLPEMLFIALFFTGMSAAIFTVDFEAPQAQRAVGAMPAVFYFAALATGSLWRAVERTRIGKLGQREKTAAFLVCGVLVVYLNADIYFVRQANDAAAWEAHNAVETLVARQMNTLNQNNTDFYISPLLHNSRVIQFLAPDSQDSRVLPPANPLPLRETGDRPVAIFLDREQTSIAAEVQRYYPNAQQTVSSNPSGDPALYSVIVQPEEIKEIQGLRAQYWPGNAPDGDPQITRVEPKIEGNWPSEAPLAPPYVAQWNGVLYIPEFGEFEFLLRSPGEATVWLDGQAILGNDDQGEQNNKLVLPQGNHRLQIQAASGEGELHMAWRRTAEAPFETVPTWAFYHSPQVTSSGLLGTYYPGLEQQSAPALMRIDPFIDSYFHLIPLERPYSVDWTGAIEIPSAGEYVFEMKVRGRAQLYIDDQLVIDAPDPSDNVQGAVNLNAGLHSVYLYFHDHLGFSRLHLYWTPPGAEREVVPTHVLIPYPQTAQP